MRLPLRLPVVLVLGLCLCPLSLIAQDDSAPRPQQPSPPVRSAPKPPAPAGSIHGTVFCGDTHKPARGAFIVVVAAPSAHENNPGGKHEGTTRTAVDGSYTIANLAEGDYGVIAMLPGYLSPLDNLTPEDMNSDGAPAKLFDGDLRVHVSGNQVATHDVTLTRGATVSGRVLYSDGSPATQVNIDVQDVNAKPFQPKEGEPNINFPSMLRNMFTHQTNGTDDEGHFRIAGLQPGTYRIAAVGAAPPDPNENALDAMGMLSGMMIDFSALHFYSGDTLHKNAAKTYELRPGDDVTGVDITIPLDGLHQVRGLLAAVDGRPINSGLLTLVDALDDSIRFTAKPTADGIFLFPGVPTGTYTLAAKDARIVLSPLDNLEPNGRPGGEKVLNAFADANSSIIVKDSDLLDVSFPLTEIPLPKDVNPNGMAAPPPPPPQ